MATDVAADVTSDAVSEVGIEVAMNPELYSKEFFNKDLDLHFTYWDTIEEANDLDYIKYCCGMLELPTGSNIVQLKIALFYHSIQKVLSTMAAIPNSKLLGPEDAKTLTDRAKAYISTARESISTMWNEQKDRQKEFLAVQDAKIQQSLDGLDRGEGHSAVVFVIPKQKSTSLPKHKLSKKVAQRARRLVGKPNSRDHKENIERQEDIEEEEDLIPNVEDKDDSDYHEGPATKKRKVTSTKSKSMSKSPSAKSKNDSKSPSLAIPAELRCSERTRSQPKRK